MRPSRSCAEISIPTLDPTQPRMDWREMKMTSLFMTRSSRIGVLGRTFGECLDTMTGSSNGETQKPALPIGFTRSS